MRPSRPNVWLSRWPLRPLEHGLKRRRQQLPFIAIVGLALSRARVPTTNVSFVEVIILHVHAPITVMDLIPNLVVKVRASTTWTPTTMTTTSQRVSRARKVSSKNPWVASQTIWGRLRMRTCSCVTMARANGVAVPACHRKHPSMFTRRSTLASTWSCNSNKEPNYRQFLHQLWEIMKA